MRQKALDTVFEIAKKDKRIIFIGSDLGFGTLQVMKEELPNQFFMEGISEQHIIGFSAGLAIEGYIPFFNTIGTFLTRRAYEQICIDIALHNLPVRLLSGGGGMVYAPLGPTHTAIEDFSLMLSIPGIQVFAPADAYEMEQLIKASIQDLRPYYIRFGKGGEDIVTSNYTIFDFKPKIFGPESPELVFCTTGVMLQECLKAKLILEKHNIVSTVIHFPYLNELQISDLKTIINTSQKIFCIEEHIPRGGLFTQILHEFAALGLPIEKIHHISLPNNFLHQYGSQIDHLEYYGLNGYQIAKLAITNTL